MALRHIRKTKNKPAPRVRSWQEQTDEEKLALHGQDLPKASEMKKLAAEILTLFHRGHEAFVAGRREDGIAAYRRIECCILRANGDEAFGSYDKVRQLIRLVEAPDGTVPYFGQPGRFVMPVLEGRCRVIVEFDDIGDLGFDVGAVDYDRPFISETGYLAIHSLDSLTAEYGTREPPLKMTLETYIDTIVRQRATHDHMGRPMNNSSGVLKPPKLYRIKPTERWQNKPGTSLSEKIEVARGPNLEDKAWQKGGWLRKLADNPPRAFVEPGANLSLL